MGILYWMMDASILKWLDAAFINNTRNPLLDRQGYAQTGPQTAVAH